MGRPNHHGSGYQPDVPAPWQVLFTIDHPPGLGCARTFLAAFREALRLDPSLEFLTIFEDDIVLSKTLWTTSSGLRYQRTQP